MIDNDTVTRKPVVSVYPIRDRHLEGKPARFRLRRTGVTAFPLVVRYGVRETGDMTNRTNRGEVTFPVGASSVIASVGTYNDSFEEDDSTITLYLNESLVHNDLWTVGTRNTSADVVVRDDPDFHKPTLSMQRIGPANIVEGQPIRIRITRTAVTDNRVLVRLRATGRGGVVNFSATLEPNVTSTIATVATVDRAQASRPGLVTVSFNNHADYNTVNPKTAVVTVNTNDPWISLSPGPGDAGATNTMEIAEGVAQTITLTLHSGGDVPRSITWSTQQSGIAVPGADFQQVNQSPVTWAVGETTKDITITVHNDMIDDAGESFTIVLNSPTNAPISFLKGNDILTYPSYSFIILITNEGALPKAYLSGMGREVSRHIVDSLSERMQAIGRGDGAQVSPRGEDEAPTFNFSEDGMAFWSSASSRDFEVADAEGNVESYTVGADLHRGDWLVGLGITTSEGEGEYDDVNPIVA